MHGALCLRLQSAARLCRVVVVRARRVFWQRLLHRGACRKSVGAHARAGDPGRHYGRGRARLCLRRSRDPSSGHLFRDGHLGLGTDGVLFLPAGEVHRRRRRHSGGAARLSVRHHRPEPNDGDVLLRARGLPVWLRGYRARDLFALRPGAEGDPRERAARHFARLSHGAIQIARLCPVGGPGGARRVDKGARVSVRLPDRCRLDDVGGGRADDTGRRDRHDIGAGRRRVSPHDDGELPGASRLLRDDY